MVNPDGAATTAYFQYGTTAAYGQETSEQNLGAATTNVAVSASLSGLAYGTTYHFRLVARNASGHTGHGNDQSFVTLPEFAGAVTWAATGVSSNTATLAGAVTPNGLASLGYFEYGLSTSYGYETSAQDAGSGTTGVPLSAAVGGLTSGQTYHYRMVATNLAGRAYGADRTLFTISPAGMALGLSGEVGPRTSSSVEIPSAPPWTVSLWYRTASTRGGVLLSSGPYNGETLRPRYEQLYLTPNGQVYLGLTNANGYQTIHSAAGYADGQWHHVAGTLSGEGLQLYLDGLLVAQDPAITNGRTDCGYWLLGTGEPNWPGMYENYLCSEVDELQIWTVARSAEEIRSGLYTLLTGAEPGLALYWRFEEASGFSPRDSSGHGNSGVTWWCRPLCALPRVPSTYLCSALIPMASGNKLVRFPVAPAATSILQASTDLVHWTNVATNQSGAAWAMQHVDSDQAPHRFYRRVSP